MGIEVRRRVLLDKEARVKGETESNAEIAILNSALMLVQTWDFDFQKKQKFLKYRFFVNLLQSQSVLNSGTWIGERGIIV